MNIRLSTHTVRPQRIPASISACIAALIAIALPPSMALAQSGDMNCDGAVNIADVPLFVDALLATGSFSGCDIYRADLNADTLINGRDMQPFVAALITPACPLGLTLCGGVCVDLMWDGNNCGACGNQCAPLEYCSLGQCWGTCVGCEP